MAEENKKISQLDENTNPADDDQLVTARAGTNLYLSLLGMATYVASKLGLGTAATVDTGTDEGEIPVLIAGGELPPSVMPASILYFKGTFVDLAALQAAHPTAIAGSYAYVDAGVGSEVQGYIWDNDDNSWHLQASASTAETPASVKTKYESNADTNAFTDAYLALMAFLDQNVTSGSSPTFNGENISGLVSGDVDQVHLKVRKGSGGTVPKGRPVYMSGYNPGGWIEVEEADNTDPAKMPAIGISETELTSTANSWAAISGRLTGQDTSAYNDDDPVYVGAAGPMVTTRPVGNALVQKMGIVARGHGSAGVYVVVGAGRSNDVPNFSAADKFWFAGTDGVASEGAITAAGRALLDDASAAAQRATLGFAAPILNAAAPGAIGGTTPSTIAGTTMRATLSGGVNELAERMQFAGNAYYSSGWKYRTANNAWRFGDLGGQLKMNVAASGAADDPITWVDAQAFDNAGNATFSGTLTNKGGQTWQNTVGSQIGSVDNSGNATFGGTVTVGPASGGIQHAMTVQGHTNTYMSVESTGGVSVFVQAQPTSGDFGTISSHDVNIRVANTTRMTIPTSGSVLVGTAIDSGAQLVVKNSDTGNIQEWQSNVGAVGANITNGGSLTSANLTATYGWFSPNMVTSDPAVAGQFWNDSGTVKISAG